MLKILLVEDDLSLQQLLRTFLHQEGYEVYTANDGDEALHIFDKVTIDFLMTDVMMPRMDGFELVSHVRLAYPNIPILILTAKNQIVDMEKGFAKGTDDYMVKPIQLKELALRVQSLCRRAGLISNRSLKIGSLVLDQESLTVSQKDETIHFPLKEFQVLFQLAARPNKIFTRLDLLDSVWGVAVDRDERVVDACIKKIRKKISRFSELKIETVRGLGYKVVIDEK